MGKKVKKLDITIAVISILLISVSLLLYTEKTTEIISLIKDKSMNVLSPFYLVMGFAIVVYCLFLCFSKYGNIKLGKEKPEYSTFSWLIMIFCTGMGSNVLYWSAIEWIYYLKAPPLGIESGSIEAMELAVTYGGFHWSITGWSIYAVGAITLGLRYYNQKRPGLCLTSCCEGFNEKLINNHLSRRIIELIFLFGTIGGYTTMISFVVPMYCNNLSILFGIENNFKFQIILILLITAIFTVSSWTGLQSGIKKLSKINIFMVMILLGIILILGPTMFIIKGVTNSVGYMLQNFVTMSLWTDFIENSGFVENWTSFYWAWWIGLAPSMWIFITKISRGRTIREILLGMIASGSLGCWLCFGIISNYGLYQNISGRVDLVGILETAGPEAAVASLVLSLPFGKVMLMLWTLTGIIFLITTMDSGTYTLAVSTTLKIGINESPTKKLRLFWSILLIALPIGLMYAGAPMGALQASTVITAVPVALLTIFTILAGIKYLKKENI